MKLSEASILEWVTAIAIISLISAVFIPPIWNYPDRRVLEGSQFLSALHRGARNWFNDEHLDKNGRRLVPSFPKQLKWTCMPKAKPCSNKTNKYLANTSRWFKQPWDSLKFAIPTTHYFQYCYRSQGVGVQSTFTLKAHSDLDCDGTFSTYMIRGWVDRKTGELLHSKIVEHAKE